VTGTPGNFGDRAQIEEPDTDCGDMVVLHGLADGLKAAEW
jgi:hypothetical protein